MMNAVRSQKRLWLYIPLLLVLAGVVAYFASFLPTADWFETFDPAARGVLTGHSPYDMPGYVYPPWAVVPLLPMVLFSPQISHGLMFIVSTFLLIYITWRLHPSPLAAAAFMLSPTAIGALLVNNIDPIVISGILLPPVWGLFLLVIKPQIGAGVALYYLYDAWKNQRFIGVLRTFAPVGVLYLISVFLFPVWIERMSHSPELIWNRSLFPYLIPVGIFLMWLAIRRKNPYFALGAALFFAPYHSFYSLICVQIALLHEDVEKVIRRDVLQIILSVFFWVIMLVFHL